jgi:hypothetical protein
MALRFEEFLVAAAAQLALRAALARQHVGAALERTVVPVAAPASAPLARAAAVVVAAAKRPAEQLAQGREAFAAVEQLAEQLPVPAASTRVLRRQRFSL